MSLRTKLLAMFVAFAVAPLIAIGVFDYVRSMGALEALIGVQTSLIVDRVAAEIRDRYQTLQANLALLEENEETGRLLRASASRDSARMTTARTSAEPYFREVWTAIGRDFDWVSLRDANDREIYRLGERGAGGQGGSADPSGARSYLVSRAVQLQPESIRGTVTASVRMGTLLPTEALALSYGRSGYTMLLDRATGRVLYGPERAGALAARGAQPRATIEYRERDSTRLASVAVLDAPAWTILSAGAIDEFASPFVAIRATNLALVLLVTAIVAGAFLLVLWRSTRSLALLTAAADEVGRGNFEPRLPARSRDEVGRLTSAFELMTGRVREMITQLEASRQMAVVGEFAAQIAHEIRNPLTSIKLNLQTLDRAARQRGLQDEASRPLDISLREVQRLDRVVHGVLRLARSRSGERTLVSLRTVIERALEVTQPHILRNGITVELALAAERCMVRADTAQLEGVFVNLFLNSAEAMPDGGTLRVVLRSQQQSGNPSLRVRVEDTGPGVPVELSERIFQPFFTTRESGTGLGLALAQRTIEEHAGMLMLERKSPAHAGASGAVFVVDLPLAWEES